MREIKSTTPPNHMECSVWIDLKSDPHGRVKKYWDGRTWVKESNDNEEVDKIKQTLDLVLSEVIKIKKQLSETKEYDDSKLHNRINKLASRVDKLEKAINE